MLTHNKNVVFVYGVPISCVSGNYHITRLEYLKDEKVYYLAWEHDTRAERDSGVYALENDIAHKAVFKNLEHFRDYT